MSGRKIDLEQISSLACLTVREGEKERLLREMEALAAFADSLEETEGDIGIAREIPLREDTVGESTPREELLGSCGGVRDGFVILPPIGGMKGEDVK